MSNIPFNYRENMLYDSSRKPSGVHVRNTQIQAYFRKYLMTKAMGVFEFTIPENWDRNYFLYTLFAFSGYISVVRTDRFGVIPQACGLMGYNVFYAPTTAIITNPLLKGILQPRIGIDCSLIKLQDNYSPITDIVDFYADRMALAYEAFDMNLINSKFAFLFGAENKVIADSLKAVFDKVQSGEPAVVFDKKLYNEDNNLSMTLFNNNLKQNYIAQDIFNTIKTIEQEFESEVGLNNANTTKRERLNADEVNANNQSLRSKAELWLESLRHGMAQTRSLFGISDSDLNVKLRFGGGEFYDSNDNIRT